MGRNLGPLNIKDSYEGLVQISGSQLTDGSGSLIPSLDVTASYAATASNADKIDIQGTAANLDLTIPTFDPAGGVGYNSLLANSSLNYNPSTGILTAPNFEGTASFATTASFALNVTPIDTGSLMVTGSVTDATLTFTKGDASTFPLIVNNVANAVSASHSVIADSSLTSISASHSVNSDTAISASYATTALSASYALTASYLEGGVSLQTVLDIGNTATQDINLTGDINATNITASNASFTSASIGFLQTITGSAVIIGDEFVVLNANTPTLRYSGLQVYDSGSAAKASFEWDGQQDIWIQVDETGLSGVMLTGNKSTKGVELFPTLNTLQKGNGDSTLSNSSITDDGTLVTINANISSSGYVSASTYYGDGSNLSGITTDTGSLLTTASYSDPLLTFTKGDGSTFDVTISSDPFPYTGSAVISGSLSVLTDVVDGYSITSGSLSGSLVDNLGQQSIVSGSAVKHIVNLSQAEYDALTPDANTLYAIDGSEVLGNTIISGSLIGDVQTIPVASNTGSLDCSLGNMFILALVGGQDVRLEASNVQQGQVINIRILNDSTAGTISFDTNVFKFEGGTPFIATATPGVVDILTTTCFEDTSYLFTVGVKDFQI